MTLSKTKNLVERQDKLEVMIEALMRNMGKLSTEMISRHDIHSRKEKEVKMFTKRALSPLDKSVAKNHDDEDDDDVVNHGIKSHTNQNL
jgi:hypothetical protein